MRIIDWSSDVCSSDLWAIDPSPALLSKAYRRAKDLPFVVEFLERTAETIPMDDQSFDAVVTTWTLCSVSDIDVALREMQRSEERRVGKGWVSTCISRWSPDN